LRQWVLDCLVLSDRPVEDFALAGVVHRLAQRGPAEAHRLGGNQNTLGVHAMENVFEAPALLADAVRGRNAKAIEENLILIPRLAPHLLDLADLDARSIDGGVEEAEPVR